MAHRRPARTGESLHHGPCPPPSLRLGVREFFLCFFRLPHFLVTDSRLCSGRGPPLCGDSEGPARVWQAEDRAGLYKERRLGVLAGALSWPRVMQVRPEGKAVRRKWDYFWWRHLHPLPGALLCSLPGAVPGPPGQLQPPGAGRGADLQPRIPGFAEKSVPFSKLTAAC